MNFDFDNINMNIKNKTYRLIGVGSGRLVYDMGNEYVVKAAKNKRGIVQNKEEHQIASMVHNNIFAKVIATSEDFNYLIMEKAEKINNISEVWNYYSVKNNRELFELEQFSQLTTKYNLLYHDLFRCNSWGLIKGKPVIIDFGFTKEVMRYYRFF